MLPDDLIRKRVDMLNGTERVVLEAMAAEHGYRLPRDLPRCPVADWINLETSGFIDSDTLEGTIGYRITPTGRRALYFLRREFIRRADREAPPARHLLAAAEFCDVRTDALAGTSLRGTLRDTYRMLQSYYHVCLKTADDLERQAGQVTPTVCYWSREASNVLAQMQIIGQVLGVPRFAFA